MNSRVPETAPPGFRVFDPEEDEETPTPIERLLGEPPIVSRGDGGRQEIALTFDDGPSRWTAAIAAAFEEHGCRATFFLRGPAVRERPDDVAALAAAGHELGNHLWSHANPKGLDRDEIRAELRRTAAAIRAAAAPAPRLVRPPYCAAPRQVARAARRTGTRAIVLRSIGSSDWAARSAEEVFAPLLASASAGAIVCLHDGISPDERDTDSREPTLEGVRRLLPALLERGLRPVTVSALLR